MSGFAIDTGSDYSSGGEVGATTPDVEEEYDDGGSSGGGSVDVGGGTVVPESGVTPEENTGTIDEGGTEEVVEDLYPDSAEPDSAWESPDFNPDGGPDAGARIPDAETFPEVDDGFSSGFWDTVLPDGYNQDVPEGGGTGWEDGTPPDSFGDGDLPWPGTEPDEGVDTAVPPEMEPDWSGDGSPGGNLTDRVPDVNVPDLGVPDPEINVDLSGIATSVIGGIVVLGLGYFLTRGGS